MKILRKYKYHLTIIVLIIIVISSLIIHKGLKKDEYNIVSNEEELVAFEEEENISEPEISYCHIDIKGAVKNPGVYQIECSKNVNDVIKLAGGLTDSANTSVINLAKKIKDEMVIIVYTEEEIKNSSIENTVSKVIDNECQCPIIKNDACTSNEQNSSQTASNEETLININTATQEELQSLSGIGESKAKAIIEYRNQNGNFQSIEDLLNVSGIGESLYEQIKVYLTT